MLQATFVKHVLEFKRPSGTSRGVLTTKDTWFLILSDGINRGIGECGMFRGLSFDDRPDFESKLQWVCQNIDLGLETLLDELTEFPAIQTGLETAFLSLNSEDPFLLFPSEFTRAKAAIPINGLIWMGSEGFMKEQIRDRLKEGFDCIKMKIGAIDFETEIALLTSIRREFSSEEIELRVDANGAFAASEALGKLKRLNEIGIHSIEQPIQQGQWQEMAKLCEETPLPIALDEELIGVVSTEDKLKLLDTIRPQFIILKPTLLGGFSGSDAWISMAERNGIGWWITSALESNVGLNAISQYTFTKNSKLPQGLGTGSLFTNNIDSPLEVNKGTLSYHPDKQWNVELFSI